MASLIQCDNCEKTEKVSESLLLDWVVVHMLVQTISILGEDREQQKVFCSWQCTNEYSRRKAEVGPATN